jgi:glycosyltransferase involved in cell wall biosynthesis
MPKKILLLTHCFSPYAMPESYLMAKRMGNLCNAKVDVITMEAFLPWMKKDLNFYEYAKKKFSNIKYLSPPKWYKYLPFSKLESFFSLPDPYTYLLPLYKKALSSLSDYDYVVTWSMYHSIHLLGPFIKKNYPSLPHLGIVKAVNKALEAKVFKLADALTFTSKESLEVSLRGQREYIEKSHVIPHCFDPKLYPPCEKPNEIFTIRYIGSFYKERTSLCLIEAIKLLHKDAPELCHSSKFKIEFIGPSEFCIDKLTDGLPKDLIEQRPPVDYMTSLKLMKEADLLLIIDAPFEKSPFLPSKLIDYIGAERPIYGITPQGSAQQTIEEMGFLTAHPSDTTRIASQLKSILQNHPKATHSISKCFHVETCAKNFMDVITNLL